MLNLVGEQAFINRRFFFCFVPLPENEIPLLLMPLGYAAEGAKPGPMHEPCKAIEETVKYL